ncbi:unnamed protein product, partial [Allacma fusca]
MISGILPVAP